VSVPSVPARRGQPLTSDAVDVGKAIRSRRTHKQYGAEPVQVSTVRELVELARHAPNHHLTQPWRFRLLGPATRAALEERCGEKEAIKLRRAPTLVLATAVLTGDELTDAEDLHATACAVYAVLLGATERGLASYWRTPAAFAEPAVREALGLGADERVVALIHLGPKVTDPPEKERAPVEDVFRTLP
jgi:nitroreductase